VITAPQRRRIVKEILIAALERYPSERTAYLEQACTDFSVRQEVESLIAAHTQTNSSFVEGPAAENARLDGGVRLASYEIKEPLGAGGMEGVDRAKDCKLPPVVALKILPPSFANDADVLVRFRREANLLASLSHPNIIMIYDIGQEGETLYIAMAFFDRKVLSEILSAGPMRIEDVFHVVFSCLVGFRAYRGACRLRDYRSILPYGVGVFRSENSSIT